jgi:hypothetical protein
LRSRRRRGFVYDQIGWEVVVVVVDVKEAGSMGVGRKKEGNGVYVWQERTERKVFLF